ncbi:MAG TPA: penicillin-binding transpeptidase domain-containing protein [Terriglobales bacterium]|nr:penicillin-binding transpeptidase domain-containing protein [Terriglobales bacterium]
MIRLLAVILFLIPSCFGADLEAALARLMRGRSGTAVVMNVASGKILASYHPEVAARRLARPGSTFKVFTLLSLIESGKVRANESFVCRRNLRVGRHNLSCSHPESGALQAVSALAYSCNDYFATSGSRLTAEELRQAFAKAGFTSATGLQKGEATGSIKLARTDEERKLQAIGEGEMKITPLELLTAFRSLALRRTSTDARKAERTVFAGLEASTEYGMGRLASPKGMKVAGKTGTSRTEGGSWTNAWFAGYAPADKPQVTVVVFLERGTGPGDAAPIAGEIFEAWKQSAR